MNINAVANKFKNSKIKIVSISILIAIFIETFVCNFPMFRTLFANSKNINANYSIQNNIDLVGETGNFTTISDFKGELNGNNYKISNLDKNIFSNNSGTIKNLELDIERVGVGGFGALCTQNEGVVENIKLYGKIEITQSTAGGAWTGGICYRNMSNGQIVKCINYAEIKGQTTFPGYIGGICSYNSGTIEKCGNEGKIWNAAAIMGGVVGINYGTIKESYNKGEAITTNNGAYSIGGISATNALENSIIQDCYNLGTIKGYDRGGISRRKSWNNKKLLQF